MTGVFALICSHIGFKVSFAAEAILKVAVRLPAFPLPLPVRASVEFCVYHGDIGISVRAYHTAGPCY